MEEQQNGTLTIIEKGSLSREFDVSIADKLAAPKPKPMRRSFTAVLPLKDQVLIRVCPEDEMTDSGLIWIPDTANEKPTEGIVLSVGRGRVDINGVFVPTEVQPGDHVLYGKYAGREYVLCGEKVRLMREEEIELVLR
jgi:chaperonin GroES